MDTNITPPDLITPGHITFLLDAPAGSSGKGKLAAYVTKFWPVNFLVTSNSPNASHTVIDKCYGKDHNIVFKALPSGSLYHRKLDKVFIAAGATFEVDVLLKEIELIGIPRQKVMIHPRAGVATPIDAAYERGECDLDGIPYANRQDGTIKTGTTASGSGAVLAKKVLRHKTLKCAKDFPEIADMIGVVEVEILAMLKDGKAGLFEVGQGFPLSNNYWRFAPNTTSRNVTVSAALNDAMLPPSVVGNVIINTRTFPIRINSKKYIGRAQAISFEALGKAKLLKYKKHGGEPREQRFEDFLAETVKETFDDLCTGVEISKERPYNDATLTLKAGKFLTWDEVQSGLFEYDVIDSYSGNWYPDQKEITWEEIEKAANIQIPQVVKNTTLTKLPRRVATFSQMNLDEAIMYNQTKGHVFISVNFMNFVDGAMEGIVNQSSLTEKAKEWIKENIAPVVAKHSNATLAFIGTSEKTDDFMNPLSLIPKAPLISHE